MPDERVRDEFGRFCYLKKQVNGPDIHMKTAGTGTEGAGSLRPWYLAVYNNFCSSPAGAVVYGNWRSDQVLRDPAGLEAWIAKNWAGIPIRQNRRPARSVKKLTQSLCTLALWMESPEGFAKLPERSYEEAWDSLDDVYTWGRYVKIKFLETCRRYLGPEYAHLEAPNIRAPGGWSPRKALSLIYPEYAAIVANKARNDRRTIEFVHSVAAELREYVSETHVPVSFYEMEALLCNYRQTLSLRKAFYVGRTIDSELEYDRKIREYWGDDPYLGTFKFFTTRARTFPERCLGEVMGWDGVRKDLSPLLTEYGILWSDLVYDYTASKDDLAHPVAWRD